jgi:hypothetical protein
VNGITGTRESSSCAENGRFVFPTQEAARETKRKADMELCRDKGGREIAQSVQELTKEAKWWLITQVAQQLAFWCLVFSSLGWFDHGASVGMCNWMLRGFCLEDVQIHAFVWFLIPAVQGIALEINSGSIWLHLCLL